MTDRVLEQSSLDQALEAWRGVVGELPAHRLGAGGDHGDTGE